VRHAEPSLFEAVCYKPEVADSSADEVVEVFQFT
jgi:hypothetical protein